MKFSSIKEADWLGLSPYLDTCLLPLSGLRGDEEPWQAAKVLSQLQTAMDFVEVPFKGRVVTYPALHYSGVEPGESVTEILRITCRNLKRHFSYVILISPYLLSIQAEIPEADLYLRPDIEDGDPTDVKRAVTDAVGRMWRGGV